MPYMIDQNADSAAFCPRLRFRVRSGWACGRGALVALFLISRAAFAVDPAPEPNKIDNVVVVVIDTLRADHLGSYGYARPTSPNIDRLAAEGVLFERAIAASSYTREAVAAIFSGQYPSENRWGSGWEATPDPDLPTLATLFKERGAHTGFFSGTPMLEGLTFHRGFDEAQCLVTQYGISGADERVANEALRWMGRNTDAPFFSYIHLLDPHAPYNPPAKVLRQFAEPIAEPIALYEEVRQHVPERVAEGFGPGEARFDDMIARYDAEIAVVDAVVGRLMTGLRALGLDQRTLVILTADHGEEFLEHDFVEHAWRLYPESVHIPMIFWAPKHLAPERVGDAVSQVDLLPTLAQVFDLPATGDYTGRSLLQRKEGAGWRYAPGNVPVYSELAIQSRNILHAVHHAGWSYFEAQRWLTPAELSATAKNHKNILRELREGTREDLDSWGEVIHKEWVQWDFDDASPTIAPTLEVELRGLLRDFGAARAARIPDATKREQVGGMTEEDEAVLESLGYLDAPVKKQES